jgi:hypothetical protein
MTLDETERLHAAGMASAVLLQIILTERDREIGGRCVCADGLGYRRQPFLIVLTEVHAA